MSTRAATIGMQGEEASAGDALDRRSEAPGLGSPSPRRESQPLASRSAFLPLLTEAELWSGYGNAGLPYVPGAVALVAPCVCGRDVIVSPNDIPLGVMAHNATPEHQSWRQREGIE